MTNYKQFDLEAAKRGEAVVTRSGLKAEYFFTLHTPDSFRYVFKVTSEKGQEWVSAYDCQGRLMLDSRIETPGDLFMAAPAIPEGFTAYDPNVPPPENAEEIEMVYALGGVLVENRLFFAQDWEKYNGYSSVGRDVRTHYRVTKWKEANPSLEDARSDVSREIYEAIMHGAGVNLANLDNALQQFADAIVQRAVDKVMDERGSI